LSTPIEKCRRCGHVGSEDSFCGWLKNYCSLSCAELVTMKQHTQPAAAATVAPVPVPQVALFIVIRR